MIKKYMTFKNIVKVTITILMTVWAQFKSIEENGSWGIGGNILMPFLLMMLFWLIPRLIKEIVLGFKNE